MPKPNINVTPLILTHNEEANIETALAALAWARKVVVVDSGSSDRTEEIARTFGNVAWFVQPFDSHSSQWSFGVRETSIDTRYILALDADMRPGTGFLEELARFAGGPVRSGLVPFEYRMQRRRLLGSIYPPQVRVFPRDEVRIEQRGHTQVFTSSAPMYRFRSKLIHEDCKPFARWVANQLRYAALEADRIRTAPAQSFRDRLRRSGISPAIWGGYAYLRAGGPFAGRAARAYAQERMVFEALLARLLAGAGPAPGGTS
ncbi:MAG TPA: glycosyltransferase [Bryobacteraceae bacterium]|nr:glycosyltransferase [Bryobacteraceae bacterium]